MDFRGTNLCQACLSDDRKIYPISELQHILNELQFLQAMNLIGGVCWECKTIILKMQKFKNQVLKAQNILYFNSKAIYLGKLSTIKKIDFDYKFIENTDPLKCINNSRNELYNIKQENVKNIDDKVEIICDIDDKYSNIHDKVETMFNIDDKFSNTDDKTNIIYRKDEKYINIDDKDSKLENGVSHFSSHYSNVFKDEHIDETKFVMNLDSGSDIKIKKKRKVLRMINKNTQSRDTEDKVLREKFTIVIFSEEEMVENREQKRNQPNFKKIPFKCDSCVLGFTTKENYNLHYEKKHRESIGPYSCPVCAIRFATPRSLDSHRRRHYVHYRCRLCKYETRQRGSAVGHGNAKHATDCSGEIHCGECGFIGGTAEDLAEHTRIKHMLTCNDCGEKFKGKHTLRTHKIRIHNSKRDYVCDICSRTFKTKSRLESHMVTHNAALARTLAYCGECNVQYKNIYVYRNHLKNSVNHSERVYHCQDCNKRFASKVYWQKHCDFYHRNKSQYKCDICDKLLISAWRLKSHMQTRHGSTRARQHACDVCEKKFFTVSTLRAHQLTHSTRRSYMCEQCGDTFKQRAALHTHTRALHTHTRTLLGLST